MVDDKIKELVEVNVDDEEISKKQKELSDLTQTIIQLQQQQGDLIKELFYLINKHNTSKTPNGIGNFSLIFQITGKRTSKELTSDERRYYQKVMQSRYRKGLRSEKDFGAVWRMFGKHFKDLTLEEKRIYNNAKKK